MRILHVCIASTFTEGMTYQENLLSAQNAKDGWDVCIVADCYAFVKGKSIKVSTGNKVLADGIQLVRLPYTRLVPTRVSRKLGLTRGLKEVINDFDPDVILHHGITGLSLVAVGRHCRKNRKVRLFLDSHADAHNSALGFLSKYIQHKFLYRLLLIGVMKYVERVFYVSPEARDFIAEHYGVPEEMLEYFPLGGVVLNEHDSRNRRAEFRGKLSLQPHQTVFLHTGKLDASKRTTVLLDAFRKIDDPKAILLIAGVVSDDIRNAVNRAVSEDSRVKLLGWINADELIGYLHAADCYIQPGTQSATLQLAICAGLPVVVRRYASHRAIVNGNGIYADDEDELEAAIRFCLSSPHELNNMALMSSEIAKTMLSYEAIAKKLY